MLELTKWTPLTSPSARQRVGDSLIKTLRRSLQTYHGSCHCGQVRFEVRTDLDQASSCDCSLCRKKGSIHHRVATDRFALTAGKEALSRYRFGTKTATHFFCKHCGVHPFHQPRVAPEMISVNLRCLDDFDLATRALEIVKFDGKNWQ